MSGLCAFICDQSVVNLLKFAIKSNSAYNSLKYVDPNLLSNSLINDVFDQNIDSVWMLLIKEKIGNLRRSGMSSFVELTLEWE